MLEVGEFLEMLYGLGLPKRYLNSDQREKKRRLGISFLRLRQIPHNFPQFPAKIRLSHPKGLGQRLKKQHNSSIASESKGFRQTTPLTQQKEAWKALRNILPSPRPPSGVPAGHDEAAVAARRIISAQPLEGT